MCKVGHLLRCCRSKLKMCKMAKAVNSMPSPDSSDSENDIDLTTLKGLFTVNQKIDPLGSSELKNSDIKL